MPLLVSIYLGLYLLLTLANGIYCLAGGIKVKTPMMVYEIVSGFLVVLMAASLWVASLNSWVGIGASLALLLVVGIDMRLTIWGDADDLGVPTEEVGNIELDVIKGISLAFAAPAYVMALMLAVDKLVPNASKLFAFWH